LGAAVSGKPADMRGRYVVFKGEDMPDELDEDVGPVIVMHSDDPPNQDERGWIFQTRVLSRWLAWLGFVVAIVLLFDVIYVNIVPFLVWVLAASIVLLMRREETTTTAA
jgi:hypothetical protein